MNQVSNRVHFQELITLPREHLEGKQVQIYGFLHQLEDESWLISSQALLQSCCAAASIEQSTSIPLKYFVPLNEKTAQTGMPVLLEGTLLSQENRGWMLHSPSIIQKTAAPSAAFDASLLFTLLGICVCLTLFIYFIRRILNRVSC